MLKEKKVVVKKSSLEAIGDSIRKVKNENDYYLLDDIPKEIQSLKNDYVNYKKFSNYNKKYASGNNLIINDSLNSSIEKLKIYGKTIQNNEPTSFQNESKLINSGDKGSVQLNILGENVFDLDMPYESNGKTTVVDSSLGKVKITYENSSYSRVKYIFPSHFFAGRTILIYIEKIDSPQQASCELIYRSGGKKHYISFSPGKSSQVDIPNDATDFQVKLLADNTGQIVTGYAEWSGVCIKLLPQNGFIPAERIQTISIPTPEGFSGIKTESEYNYIDNFNQKWICDEIDFDRGVYIKRILKCKLQGLPSEQWTLHSVINGLSNFRLQSINSRSRNVKEGINCNRFISTDELIANANQEGVLISEDGTQYYRVRSSDINSLSAWKDWLSKNPIETEFVLKNPIELPLSSEQKKVYKDLKTNSQFTNIISNNIFNFSLEYLVNSQDYIDALTSDTAITAKKSGYKNINIIDHSKLPLINLQLFGRNEQETSPSQYNPAPLLNYKTIEVKVYNKNLLCFPYLSKSGYQGYEFYWEVFDNGAIHVKGSSGEAYKTFDLNNDIDFKPGTTYYLNQSLLKENAYIVVRYFGEDLKVHYFTSNSFVWNKNYKLQKVYLQVNPGIQIDEILYPMISVTPIDDNLKDFVPFNQQAIIIPTSQGFSGIQTEKSVGNYTDENGQSWICDEVDFNRGVYIKRIEKVVLSGKEEIWPYSTNEDCLPSVRIANAPDRTPCLCNYARQVFDYKSLIEKNSVCNVPDSSRIVFNLWGIKGFGTGQKYQTSEDLKRAFRDKLTSLYDSGNPVIIHYALSYPIETKIPIEILQKYRSLYMNFPETNIFSNNNINLSAEYVLNSKNAVNDIINSVSTETYAKGNLLQVYGGKNTPLKKLSLYGKTLQNSIPTLEAPAPLISIGEEEKGVKISLTGENLINYKRAYNENSLQTAIEFIENGFILKAKREEERIICIPVNLFKGKTYTLSFTAKVSKPSTTVYAFLPETEQYFLSGVKFTPLKNVTKIGIYIQSEDIPETAEITRIMLQYNNKDQAKFYCPYKSEQRINLSLSNGLPGIPVEKDGNYTDENGQSWICDEVDFERGMYIKRVATKIYNGEEDWKTENIGDNRFRLFLNDSDIANYPDTENKGPIICNRFITESAAGTYYGKEGVSINNEGNRIYTYSAKYNTSNILLWKNYLKTNPITVVFETRVQETPLSPEEIKAYKSLRLKDGLTNIFNNIDSEMKIKYSMNSKYMVDPPIPRIKMTETFLPITKNGEYNLWHKPDCDAMESVKINVNVPTTSGEKEKLSILDQTIVENNTTITFLPQTYNADGFSKVRITTKIPSSPSPKIPPQATGNIEIGYFKNTSTQTSHVLENFNVPLTDTTFSGTDGIIEVWGWGSYTFSETSLNSINDESFVFKGNKYITGFIGGGEQEKEEKALTITLKNIDGTYQVSGFPQYALNKSQRLDRGEFIVIRKKP